MTALDPQPRLLYIGNFRPAHSTENHIARSFASLGWDVLPVQEDEVAGAWGSLHERAHQADLVLYTRTQSMGLTKHKADTLWASLEANGVPTASVHLDKFVGLDRETLVHAGDPLFTTRFVFTADGDPHPWARWGVRHQWLRAGVLADECKPGAVDGRWAGHDVAFVGTSVRYHREWKYRERMLAAMQAEFGDRLLIVPRPGKPAVRGWALNDLYATVPVVIGDSLSIERERSRFWSDRAYETCGRGGFLVHPRIDALRAELAAVESIRWYEWNDFDGLASQVHDLVDLFKADPERRRMAVEQGSAWVRDNCSYAVRVAEMLDTIGLPYCAPCLNAA